MLRRSTPSSLFSRDSFEQRAAWQSADFTVLPVWSTNARNVWLHLDDRLQEFAMVMRFLLLTYWWRRTMVEIRILFGSMRLSIWPWHQISLWPWNWNEAWQHGFIVTIVGRIGRRDQGRCYLMLKSAVVKEKHMSGVICVFEIWICWYVWKIIWVSVRWTVYFFSFIVMHITDSTTYWEIWKPWYN
jgi:hypothetical protein